MRLSKVTTTTLALPWLVTFGSFWLFPIIYSFVIGFTDYNLLARDFSWIGLENYKVLLGDKNFISAVKNTFIFVLGTIPLTTIISLGLALLVNRSFPGRAFFRAGYFVPSITSMIVIALIFTNLFQRGGYIAMLAQMAGFTPPEHGFLYNDSTALYSIMAMDIWMAVGYYMLIFLSGLKSIPNELYEAAKISGAGHLRQFWSITLPMLRPVALFIVVINTIKSFQVMVEIFVMTSGKFDTATMVYFIYEEGLTRSFQFGYASAAAYILFGIVALFSILQFVLLRRRHSLW